VKRFHGSGLWYFKVPELRIWGLDPPHPPPEPPSWQLKPDREWEQAMQYLRAMAESRAAEAEEDDADRSQGGPPPGEGDHLAFPVGAAGQPAQTVGSSMSKRDTRNDSANNPPANPFRELVQFAWQVFSEEQTRSAQRNGRPRPIEESGPHFQERERHL